MTDVKKSIKPETEILKFQKLSKDREGIIKLGFTDAVKSTYKANQLASLLHPGDISVKVTKIVSETPNTKSFYFAPVEIESLPPFEAGQYITLTVKINDSIYKRAYSISSSPTNLKEYRITIQKEHLGMISNYMFNECLEQDIFTISGPFGNFKYNAIRDLSDILAIAGGSGITPIMSLVYSCIENHRPENLTLLYGAKTEQDIIFKKELDELVANNNCLKVEYVLSEEKRINYEYGFIDKEKILKENPLSKSIFVCGPTAMYESLNTILKELDIPNKYIRHEIYTTTPSDLGVLEHQLHIKTLDKIITIPCYENKTLLSSMEKYGINAPAHCTVGVCGFCRSKLINGKVKTESSSNRMADVKQNYLHPCVTYPMSDITIELPF